MAACEKWFGRTDSSGEKRRDNSSETRTFAPLLNESSDGGAAALLLFMGGVRLRDGLHEPLDGAHPTALRVASRAAC